MSALFYISGIVAIISAGMVITRANAMHALVYLVLLFLSIAAVFFTLGASFVALLQVIIYAGAILILFVFVIMLLGLGRSAEQQERSWLPGRVWILPAVLAVMLLGQFVVALTQQSTSQSNGAIAPKAVGISLFTNYIIGVELASFLLLAALVAAFRLGSLSNIAEETETLTQDKCGVGEMERLGEPVSGLPLTINHQPSTISPTQGEADHE